ncbi:MAG: T9SS type A sorting domain-containing protein [Bacteroidota bacterium]
MKTNRFLLVGLLLAIFSMSFAQTSENYYTYSQKKSHYYDSLRAATPDTLKVPGMRSFQRWNDFWRDRVYNSPTEHGTYVKYATNLQAAIANPAFQPSNSATWNWQPAADQNMSTHNRGIIVSLWINPNNINEIYAGSNTSGMFRTINGGAQWECVTDNINLPSMGVNDIAVHPTNTNIKYIAQSMPFGGGAAYIHKTNDNCSTWQTVLSMPVSAYKAACRVVIDPVNPDIVYALMHDEVYRSMDAGASWQLIFNSLTYAGWDQRKMLLDIEFKPNDHNTVFITGNGITSGYTHTESAELWFTTNATSSTVIWQRIETGLPDYCDRYILANDPNNSSVMYIGYSIGIPGMNGWADFNVKKLNLANYTLSHVYNKNWYNLSDIYTYPFGGIGYWCTGMEVSPTNSNLLFCGGYNLEVLNMPNQTYTFFNYNGAPSAHATWHVDQRVFKTATANGKTYLFCGNDGGVSRYEYETGIMISCNGLGFDNNQYYGIGHAEVDPDFYIGGTQDNGVIGNGSGSFKATVMGDAYEVIVDPITPNICYATANGGRKSIVKSIDYFNSYTSMNNGIPYNPPGLNARPFNMSPSTNSTLYVGYNELYRTTNATSNSVTWQKISDFQNSANPWITTNDMKAIGLTKANPNLILIGFTGPTWADANQARLFKTTDGGVTWSNISAGLGNTIHYTSITDIAISPVDANKIWVTFSGYWTNSSGNAINKVYYSSNGGTSWTDVTYNLPDLNVNCANGLMVNNTYRPLIGNDLGVFLFDPTTNSWQNISNGLPHVIASDIEIDYSHGQILIGTYGRGIWKTDIPCAIGTENTSITSSLTWSENRIVSGVVSIEPNQTLTIKNTVALTEGSKFIVKPGAKLIVDGATLTKACNDQWQGIEVWGNTLQHQYTVNGVCAQGTVELRNGAVIENAVNGITNWRPDDWNSIGGIIIATGATFRNNRRSVEFMKYRNFIPNTTTEANNFSVFNNCTFEVNDNYSTNASPYYTGVSLWYVKGVKFNGCDFLNNRSVAGTGYGIFSLDAGYNVSAICNSQTTPCPEVYLDKSYFKGFLYGIQASNSETSYTINIQNSKFTDNGYGIEMRNINNAVILKNRFEMAQASNCPNYGYGLNLISCTGYAIEENTFVGGNIPPTNSYSGIEITNSGAAYNEVYKNTFQNVTVGNLADLQNGSDKILPPTGLTYLCNTNTGNKYDFYVTNKLESWISPYQRSGTATAAANSFSTNAIMNFDNGGKSKVFYFHTAGGAPYSYYGVQLVLTSNTNTCPSHYGGGSDNLVSLNQSQNDAKELQFADAFSAYNNVNALYETLKDGGNTANTVEDIETSIPSEMWELRAKLLGDSPHLSQKALEEAALKTDVLPESVLFEILSANPDEMRDEQFLSFLQTKENPLPEYMIDLLRQIAGNTSYKTVLQEQLNMFDNQKTSAASDILRSKLHDTVVDQSGIINWFDNKGDLLSRYQIVDMYLQSGNSGAAQAMLTLIPALHQFSSKDTAEYQKFAELKTLQINLATNGRNLSMLNTTEKEQLIAIADFGHGIASTQAKGILEFWEGIPYCNCIRYNDELKHAAVKPGTQPSLPVDAIISANPNPATTWIAFDYKLPDTYASVNLSIFDNNGRLIDNVLLTGNQGQRVLNTSSYASGTYVYKCDQINTISGKFIIK